MWLLVRYLRWGTTNFVITSDRVIFRHGVIAKSGIEIPLERVNSVHFDQGIFERMLGAGDLLIESGAESGQQRFTDVRNPDRVQNLIHSQMELNEDRMHGRVNRDGTPAAARGTGCAASRRAVAAGEAGGDARPWHDHPGGVRGPEAPPPRRLDRGRATSAALNCSRASTSNGARRARFT